MVTITPGNIRFATLQPETHPSSTDYENGSSTSHQSHAGASLPLDVRRDLFNNFPWNLFLEIFIAVREGKSQFSRLIHRTLRMQCHTYESSPIVCTRVNNGSSLFSALRFISDHGAKRVRRMLQSYIQSDIQTYLVGVFQLMCTLADTTHELLPDQHREFSSVPTAHNQCDIRSTRVQGVSQCCACTWP